MMMNANKTLDKTLFNGRIKPELSADDVWGEVRSLVQGELSGGEQWSEWSELFTRRPLRDEHFLYIQNAWKPPVQVTDMRSLRRAFELRVLVANERAHKEANLARFNPPATIERLEKWRQRSNTALPPYLRACLLELGDGMRPGERGESSISSCLEEHGPGIMAMRSFTEHMDYVRADGHEASHAIGEFVLGMFELLDPMDSADVVRLEPTRPRDPELVEQMDVELFLGVHDDSSDRYPSRDVLSIVSGGVWADEVYAPYVTDEPYIGDPDVDMLWFMDDAWDEETDEVYKERNDHCIMAFKRYGHLVDWLYRELVAR